MRLLKLLTAMMTACCRARLVPWLVLAAAVTVAWECTAGAFADFSTTTVSFVSFVVVVLLVVYWLANMVATIFGFIIICEYEGPNSFRSYSLPVVWWEIFHRGRSIQLWEPAVWTVFSPAIAAVTLVEALRRHGGVTIRRDRWRI